MVRRPYPTNRDLTYPTTDAVWRALRELRAAPPGWATSSVRKATFSSALEQAQQLFTAAAAVGPASRPLLLFYGLSQAGRAIAACAPVPNDKFKLNGHGIANDAELGPLPSVLVHDKGSGAFTQLAAMLGSRSLPDPMELGELWVMILEVESWPLAPTNRPLLHVTWEGDSTAADGRQARALVSGMPRSLVSSSDADERESAVRTWLAAYPSLNGHDFVNPGVLGHHGPVAWNERTGTIGCRLVWPAGDFDGAAPQRVRKITPWRGRDQGNAYRTIHADPKGAGQLHPLLSWWAVLYTLSMQARYLPDRWNTHIDVNRAASAVPVEYLLDAALSAVPELVLAAIEDLV